MEDQEAEEEEMIQDVSSEEDEIASVLMESDIELPESSDEEDTLEGDYTSKDSSTWAKTPPTPKKTSQRNIFRPITRHVRNAAENILTPLQAFFLFFTRKVFEQIVLFTNMEGVRQKGNRWKPTDVTEIMALVGLYIHLGSRKLNLFAVERIWQGVSADPVAKAAMSARRFQTLGNALRFDDKDTRSHRRRKDIFAPFRDIFDEINANLSKNYIPDVNLTVDEQLIPWRGRVKFLQYLPSKPDKYGMKVFWICDSSNGYPLHGIPYLGKHGDMRKNVGQETVKELTLPYLKSGRNVTTDNFFTDITLAQWLCKNGLSLVGTLRRNKPYIPPEFKDAKALKKGESLFGFKNESCLVSYKSNCSKNVILLSTMHNTIDIDIDDPKKKPAAIKYYNSTKGGVDLFDQMAHSFSTKRKSRRWPMIYFYNMIDTASVASFICFRETNPGNQLSDVKNRGLFQEELGKLLITDHMIRRKAIKGIRRDIKSTILYVCGKWGLVGPEETETSEGDRVATAKPTSTSSAGKGRCKVCPRRNDRKIRSKCTKCACFVCGQHSTKRLFCMHCKAT